MTAKQYCVSVGIFFRCWCHLHSPAVFALMYFGLSDGVNVHVLQTPPKLPKKTTRAIAPLRAESVVTLAQAQALHSAPVKRVVLRVSRDVRGVRLSAVLLPGAHPRGKYLS
jgi:hypothetical protein